jgi:hypothetical protein
MPPPPSTRTILKSANLTSKPARSYRDYRKAVACTGIRNARSSSDGSFSRRTSDARLLSQDFFAWYNDEHRHYGLGLVSPAVVYHGLAHEAIERRRAVLDGCLRSSSRDPP